MAKIASKKTPKKTTDLNLQNGKKVPENPVAILHQYLKDLSFESPQSPDIFIKYKTTPEVDLSINVGCDPLQDHLFEVALTLQARIYDKAANTQEKDRNHFLVEMKYAGVIRLHKDLDNTLRNPALLIEAPRLLFPYARSILSDITRDGGFPPLFIQPIDFASLYRKELMQRKENQAPKND